MLPHDTHLSVNPASFYSLRTQSVEDFARHRPHHIAAAAQYGFMHYAGWLRRHPFSEPFTSAGELLHTPQRIPTFMATVRLSRANNILSGFLVSQHSDTLTALSDHPASPVLLTSNSPRGAWHSIACLCGNFPCSRLASHEAAGHRVVPLQFNDQSDTRHESNTSPLMLYVAKLSRSRQPFGSCLVLQRS